MRKLFLSSVILLLAVAGTYAEAGKWSFKGMFGGSYNAVNVTDNWSGKETDSQSWGASLDVSGIRDSGITNWANTLQEKYGRTKVAGTDESTSNDIIDFSSVYTRKVDVYVNPYVAFIMDTQNWKVFEPVVFTESAGNGVWIINKPEHVLKTRVGIAFKQTYDTIHQKIDPATGAVVFYSAADDSATPWVEQVKHETGAEWVTNYDVRLTTDTRLISEARVFDAFEGGDDLRWDTSLFTKLSSIVTLQLNYLAIYNFERNPQPVWPQDIEKRITLIIGVSYNLF